MRYLFFRLSRIARLLLFDLGSALVQNLSYRGSWYLITQKGITGFSPFEDVSFSYKKHLFLILFLLLIDLHVFIFKCS